MDQSFQWHFVSKIVFNDSHWFLTTMRCPRKNKDQLFCRSPIIPLLGQWYHAQHTGLKLNLGFLTSCHRNNGVHKTRTKSIWETRFIQILGLTFWRKNQFKVDLSTLVSLIIMQDGIKVQDGKISKTDKHAGWNKAV